ncbi:sigma-70 family RNA polymerase sigma factor [uncultured Maribacter sp.]|uniref:sigma-70 family RNA polymerase sigma factor n=1 Tax=uncultured Maribacter sp. TaxID=431308 RepID=UPI0026114AE9|nr:sigma-70 family RNA polymerase sigma factor [uncultured Maribacter sp.]
MKDKFTELLYENQGIVHKICNIYFRDRLEKEDYHQELIIQLWKAFPSFNNTSKFSTWMYRVCVNAAINITKKEKKQVTQVKLFDSNLHNLPNNDDTNCSNQEKLYEAISKLSNVDKAIITLYLDEYSYEEISEIIGISKNNTGVKIKRIKSKILKSFENGNS